MKKNIRIIILAVILTIEIFTLSGCGNKEQENTTNTTNQTNNTTSNVSIRDQIIAQQVNMISGMQNQTTAEVNIEDLKKYTKEADSNYKTCTTENGASFMYPSNWVAVNQVGEVAFMAPDAKGSSVNFATDSLSKSSNLVTDFDGYMALQKLALTQQMPMLSELKQEIINLNGRKAYILNYETETAESGTKIQLNVTQVAFDDNGEINILTLAVLRDYYNELQPTFEKMIKSFVK